MALLEVQDLVYYYPDTNKPALDKISFNVEEGEFILVAGGSGSGKSSLARVLAGLIPDFYGGKFGGKVLFEGKVLRDIDRRLLGRKVGIVFQDPEKQLVMTGVEAEIAFGLENLGLPQDEMFRRVAEVMAFLDLTGIKDEFTASLSGGQKQKLALASVLAMHPKMLIMDEPTSQLDPAAAEELLNLIKRLNEELGLTVILIEQRLERCFQIADRLMIMDNGQIIKDGSVEEVAGWQVKKAFPFIPPVAKFFVSIGAGTIPVTIKEGRKTLKSIYDNPWYKSDSRYLYKDKTEGQGEQQAAVELNKVWFSYPDGHETLRNVTCRIKEKEFTVILGENAAGKSTLLKIICGLLKPARGSVLVKGRDATKKPLKELALEIGYLSQNPNDYLFQDTVEEELLFSLNNFGIQDDGRVEFLLNKLGLTKHKKSNPRDLSGGERQRVALAAVLVLQPKILLLDEPTRGIDYRLKNELGKILTNLVQDGVSVIMVTHDIEFAAEYAGRVLLMSDGRVVCEGTKYETLGESMFYSPQMNRLFKGIADGILTVDDAIREFQKNDILRDGTNA